MMSRIFYYFFLAFITVWCYYCAMDKKVYTITELSERTGYSRRTIHYYVQQGLIGPPAGRGRGGFYNDSHLQKLLEIRAQQEQGFKLSAIQTLSEDDAAEMPESERDVWVRYQIIPGFEINIRRDIEDNLGRRVTEIIRMVRSLITRRVDE
jgi:DNA-binding transcriptional MerR regulator